MNQKQTLVSIVPLLLASIALARDVSHYPYDSFAYAGKFLKMFSNAKTGAELALFVDHEFSDQQNELLKKATTTLSERYISKPVLDCAYASSVRELPESRELFVSQMKEVMGPKTVDPKVPEAKASTLLFVAGYSDDKTSVGMGFLNLYYDTDTPFPGYSDRHYLYIALNDDYLGKASYQYGTDSDYWAGVMAHQILHNLNYDHRSGYSGSFITEYSKCLWKNGVQFDIPEGVFNDRIIERGM